MQTSPTVVILGPQRFRPTLRPALDSIDVAGPVAIITAGWQEREEDIDEFREHLACETIHLRLYQRFDELRREDPQLEAALRQRQERLYQLQLLYRLRLDAELDSVQQLMSLHDGGELLVKHRRSAIRVLKTLDRQHLVGIRAIHRDFDERWRPSERPALARQLDQLREQLQPARAVALAGGHVAVLLNRLRLYDFPSLVGERPVVAWSAGAMALAERVVLFHDSPPQGAGNAEVLESGLAMFKHLVPLPLARRRLRLDNPVRVAILARRLHPAVCTPLDEGDRLDWDGSGWQPQRGTRRLGLRGAVRKMNVWGRG